MKEEKRKNVRPVQEAVPDEDSAGALFWSKSQWRQFITVFTMATIVVSGTFWFFLIRQEIGIRQRYTALSVQFDREWSYLQKLARLERIRLVSGQDGTNEAVFTGRRLNVSFSYPKAWGEFEESKPTTYYMSAGLKRGTLERFIGAYNRQPPISHGSGWDSVAVGMWTPDDIERVCERNTLADTCLTLTTRSGIRYARIRYDHFLEVDGAVDDVVIYVFVNPESEFPAMALSNIGLRKSSIPHRISDMDAIMESMVFHRQ